MQAMEQARDQAEGVRLAYVAATRARDLLVVPAIGDEEFEGGWTGPLDAALYPDVSQRRAAVAAPGCPPFKKDSVLVRPDNDPASAHTVAPGLFRFDGSHDVVWWDPSVLRLGAEPPFGLRRQELIVKDVAPEIVHAGLRRYKEWTSARETAIRTGEKPSIDVRTATEWALADGSQPLLDDVEVIVVEGESPRTRGARYGTLVHAALATLPLDADERAIEQMVDVQSRIVGATEEERAAAIVALRNALAHPVFDRVRAADARAALMRETPLTIVAGDTLVEGVADCVFEEDAGYVVIDFKTDRAAGDQLERYRRQVSLYARAVAAASARPARAILLLV
jgi:hypothetical protein